MVSERNFGPFDDLDDEDIECALMTLAELAQHGLSDPDDVLSERQREVAERLATILTAMLGEE